MTRWEVLLKATEIADEAWKLVLEKPGHKRREKNFRSAIEYRNRALGRYFKALDIV